MTTPSLKKNFLVLIFFVIFTIFFTYPLTLQMNSVIPGYATTDEPLAAISYLWTVKHCTIHKLDLRLCNFVAYPFGMNFKDYTGTSYIWEFIKNSLTFLTNEIFTFNFLVLLSFVLSGWFTYLLAYYLWKSNLVALFSGFIFTFSPYHFTRAWQHLSLSHIQWIPLYLLSLLCLKDKPSIKNILFVAFSLFLLSSFNFYYAYLMVITTATFIVFFTFQKRKSLKVVINSCMRLCFACLFALILLFPSLGDIYKNRNQFSANLPLGYNFIHRPFNDLFLQSARPLSYFLPAPVHPLFGKFTEQFIGSSLYGKSLTEHALYLGWAPLTLAFVAIRRWRKMRKVGTVPFGMSPYNNENFYIGFFILLAITAWFFSQPPWWKMGPIKIYMPSFFMYKILPMFRAYCRFGIVVMLAIAVLAGFGLKFVLERFKTQKAKIAITCLFAGLVLFEFWNWPPYKVIDVSKVPAVYYWLKEQPGNVVIAEYPLDANSPNEMYKFYQTKHEKKIINGAIPGTHANKIAQTVVKLSDPKTAGVLKWMGVKYVLVHKEDYLKTGLIEQIEEVDKIPGNPGLKSIRSFPSQQCPQKDIMCVQETGPIDVYEVVTEPKEPALK